MSEENSFIERMFHLRENGTTVKTEFLAGITTFMTMAYILAVNPTILSATGMDKGAVLTATVLASCLGTVFMAIFANYPFALAPGMGLNAFFAYTVVLQMGYSWEMALSAVFVEGIIFIVLSLTNIREAIFNAIPMTLKKPFLPVSAYLSHLSVYLTRKSSSATRQRKFPSFPLKLPLLPERFILSALQSSCHS